MAPVPGTPPRAPARAHPVAVLALIAAGGVAAIGLWWQDTPAIHGLGDWLTNAGRLTGLACGYGVVVLVALMARLPPLERGVGADRLARWHAMGGRYIVSLVVAHALLITWGYAVTAHTSVISQTKTLLMSYPDVIAATLAGVMFVGVGISSARAARRHLRYETWYYLHFYTYLAIALAFSHQFANGAEFMRSLPARVVWSALYAGVTAAIGWYRFITPARQAMRHRLRVLSVTREGPGVVSIVITGQHLDELRAEPGQFFRWRFLTRDRWWTSSPYSLSAPPQARPAAHHRQVARRAQPRPGGAAARHPRARRGTVWCPHRRGPAAAQGAADRRRRRHHSPAGAVRGDSRGPWRPGAHLPGQPRQGRGVPP